MLDFFNANKLKKELEISTSLLQRRLKIGYGRAGKLVDELEKLGMISGYRGSKPREVFISKDTWNEMNRK